MSEHDDAGTCNDAAAYSHQSIIGRIFSVAGRRAGGRAKTAARINVNDDWRRFTQQVARATQAEHSFFMDVLVTRWWCLMHRF
jgi:hypothetical protein